MSSLCFIKRLRMAAACFAMMALACVVPARVCPGEELFTIEDIEDSERLPIVIEAMKQDVLSVRGLEIQGEYSVEYMTMPDFAYYRYVKAREERDVKFHTGLSAFLKGYSFDEEELGDPGVAAIAGSRQVAGMYDPEDRHLIITQGSSSMFGFLLDLFLAMDTNKKDMLQVFLLFADLVRDERRIKTLASRQTIFHELVHAAQDSNFDIGWWELFSDSDLDFFMALKSIAEGDAEFSSKDFLCREFGMDKVEARQELFKIFIDPDEKRKKNERDPLSRLFINPLGTVNGVLGLFPYLGGPVFVGAVHAESGYKGVDDLFRTPPATTRQILHPTTDGDGDFDVAAIGYGPSPEDVFESRTLSRLIVDDNIALDTTVGELGINAILAGFLIYQLNEDPAEGWAGDRLRVYVNEDLETVALWYLMWETPEAAIRFIRAYHDILKDKCSNTLKPLRVDISFIDTNLCGTQYMENEGNTVIIVEIPERVEENDADLKALVDYAHNADVEIMTAAELSQVFTQRARDAADEDGEDENGENDEEEEE